MNDEKIVRLTDEELENVNGGLFREGEEEKVKKYINDLGLTGKNCLENSIYKQMAESKGSYNFEQFVNKVEFEKSINKKR